MELHFNLTDIEFINALEEGTLDPALFSHEAHLRLAWIQINNYGVENAIACISHQLSIYVAFLNASDKYNATLTVAAIRTVKHFMDKSKSSNFRDFITEFPRLKYNFKELIGLHYGFDIFNSVAAKNKYLEPDLLPFE
tara:strand:- start:312 stop:725 length:414 start_codon:yes stop_codon:yes gene_type:complete